MWNLWQTSGCFRRQLALRDLYPGKLLGASRALPAADSLLQVKLKQIIIGLFNHKSFLTRIYHQCFPTKVPSKQFPNQTSPKDEDGRFDGCQSGVAGPLRGRLCQSFYFANLSNPKSLNPKPMVFWATEIWDMRVAWHGMYITVGWLIQSSSPISVFHTRRSQPMMPRLRRLCMMRMKRRGRCLISGIQSCTGAMWTH